MIDLNPPLKQYNVLTMSPIRTDVPNSFDSNMVVSIIFPSIIRYGAGDMYNKTIGVAIIAEVFPIYFRTPLNIELILYSIILSDMNSEYINAAI